MTCILARGWEHGSIWDFDYLTTSANITIGTGVTYKRPGGFSNYGVGFTGANVGRFILNSAVSELFLQVAVYCSVRTASCHVIKWKSGTTVLGSLYYDYTLGVFKLYVGDAATLVATGTTGLGVGIWNIFELRVKIADANDGVLEFRLNGRTECLYSGVGADTKPGADTAVDTIEFTAASTFLFNMDDVIVNDTAGSAPGNTWPTGAYVTGLPVTGAGATTGWTASTGNNWDCVNEVPPVTTDYVSINANDTIDSYVMTDLPAAASIVLGVEVSVFCVRVGISTPTKIKALVRYSGTDYPESSGQTVLITDTVPLRKCWGQNPGTGPADWTVANVNALEVGFKSAA